MRGECRSSARRYIKNRQRLNIVDTIVAAIKTSPERLALGSA